MKLWWINLPHQSMRSLERWASHHRMSDKSNLVSWKPWSARKSWYVELIKKPSVLAIFFSMQTYQIYFLYYVFKSYWKVINYDILLAELIIQSNTGMLPCIYVNIHSEHSFQDSCFQLLVLTLCRSLQTSCVAVLYKVSHWSALFWDSLCLTIVRGRDVLCDL